MITRRDMFKGLLGAGAGVALGKAALGDEVPLPGPNIKKLILDPPVKVAPEPFIGYNQSELFDSSQLNGTTTTLSYNPSDMDVQSSDNMLWVHSDTQFQINSQIDAVANVSANKNLDIVIDGRTVARFTKEGLGVI